jgi:two-component system chemotaxis response regulator CheB
MNNYEAIVIGVSAGGLQALNRILPHLDQSLKTPVIIVQHQQDEHENMLSNLLNNMTTTQVKEVEFNEVIKPQTIYVAPSGYHLQIEADKSFSLSRDPKVEYSRPSIDVLFESAADVFKNKLIGVILTGANDDGSNGLKKVRELGGLAIVESPATAEVATMPERAITIAGADHVLSIDKMGLYLKECCNGQ